MSSFDLMVLQLSGVKMCEKMVSDVILQGYSIGKARKSK